MCAPAPRETWDCLIVANGAAPAAQLLKRLRSCAHYLLAVDGALKTVLDAGATPDYVVGDFDSVTSDVLDQLPTSARVYVPEPDRCDLEKALELALRLKCQSALITGGLGGRIDHTLTTVSLLLKYADRLALCHRDGHAEVIPVGRSAVVRGEIGQTLSLIALAPVRGVTLTGVRWPLHRADLLPGSLGVSNVLTEREAHLDVEHGVVLVCRLLKVP